MGSSRKDQNPNSLAPNTKALLFCIRVVHKILFGKIKETPLLKIIIWNHCPSELSSSSPPLPAMGHIPSTPSPGRKHLEVHKTGHSPSVFNELQEE